MTQKPKSLDVVIIGAGVVGAATAVELTSQGYRVTILEPEQIGGPHGPSYGNGAFISPASIIPMSFPGMWRKIAGYLTDPLGPVAVNWRQLPRLLPWLWRFVWAGATAARYGRCAADLNLILQDAPARHLALAKKIGRPDLIVQSGLIYAFRDRAAKETESRAWALRAKHGVAMTELEGPALQALLPDLSTDYGFGVLLNHGAHCKNPSAYVRAMLDWATRHGARLIATRATGFDAPEGQIRQVLTDQGPIACDKVVIAAGAASAHLARLAGDKIPLGIERGYHIELAGLTGGPAIPVMPQDGKMANTIIDGRLRAAGQVEITLPHSPPDWRRAEILLAHLKRSYPALNFEGATLSRWCGDRPSTPDGRPVLGHASGISGVIYAFGHGHIGLASSAFSAQMVADLLKGTAPSRAIQAFGPKRF